MLQINGVVVTLLLESFINKCFHGSKVLDTANWMEQKLNGVKKSMLLLRYIPAKNPRATIECAGSLCSLQHPESDVWRMEAGQMCLWPQVLAQVTLNSCSRGARM